MLAQSAVVVVVSKELVLSETCAKYDKSSDNLTQDYQNKGAEPDPEAGLRVRDVGLALLWVTPCWYCFLSPV